MGRRWKEGGGDIYYPVAHGMVGTHHLPPPSLLCASPSVLPIHVLSPSHAFPQPTFFRTHAARAACRAHRTAPALLRAPRLALHLPPAPPLARLRTSRRACCTCCLRRTPARIRHLPAHLPATTCPPAHHHHTPPPHTCLHTATLSNAARKCILNVLALTGFAHVAQ